jgi:hypothetical protein
MQGDTQVKSHTKQDKRKYASESPKKMSGIELQPLFRASLVYGRLAVKCSSPDLHNAAPKMGGKSSHRIAWLTLEPGEGITSRPNAILHGHWNVDRADRARNWVFLSINVE